MHHNFKVVISVIILSLVITIGSMTYIQSVNDGYPKYDKISLIECDMSKQDVFTLLGDKEWSDYGPSGFEYSWRYVTPSGRVKTFKVLMDKRDKVTLFYSY